MLSVFVWTLSDLVWLILFALLLLGIGSLAALAGLKLLLDACFKRKDKDNGEA